MAAQSISFRDIAQWFFVLLGAIAILLALFTVIRRVTAYYRTRYHFSLWSGVLVVVIACALSGFCYARYGSFRPWYVAGSAGLLVITAFLDVHHAGWGMGLLAFVLEAVLSVFFAAIVLVGLVYVVIRAFRRGDDFIVNRITGTTEGFRAGTALFLRFFIL